MPNMNLPDDPLQNVTRDAPDFWIRLTDPHSVPFSILQITGCHPEPTPQKIRTGTQNKPAIPVASSKE